MNRLLPEQNDFFNTIESNKLKSYLPIKMQKWKEYNYSESNVELESKHHKTIDFVSYFSKKPIISPINISSTFLFNEK